MIRLLALLALLAAPAQAQIASGPSAMILTYGIYCAEGGVRVPSEAAAAGFVIEGRVIEHRATTLTVPARLGLTFGFEYAPTRSIPPGGVIRTTHPPFEEGGRTVTEYPIAEVLMPDLRYDWWYTFDEPFEQVTGPWTLEVIGPDGVPLVTARFTVIPDDPNAPAPANCGAPMVS